MDGKPMTMDRAHAEAHRRWGNHPFARGLVWLGLSGLRCVGWTDGESRYCMGSGKTWEEAFADADRRGKER